MLTTTVSGPGTARFRYQHFAWDGNLTDDKAPNGRGPISEVRVFADPTSGGRVSLGSLEGTVPFGSSSSQWKTWQGAVPDGTHELQIVWTHKVIQDQTVYGHRVYLDDFSFTPGPAPTLALSDVSHLFSESGGVHAFQVLSSGAWSWSKSASWITSTEASPQSGNRTFTYQVQPNTTASSRTGTITFTGAGGSPTVAHTVTQAAYVPRLTIDHHAQRFGSEGGDHSLFLSSNLSWYAIDNASWIRLGTVNTTYKGDRTVTYTVSSNRTTQPRTAEIRFRSSLPDVIHAVTQDGAVPHLTLGENVMEFSPRAASHAFDVEVNVTDLDWFWTSDVSWIGGPDLHKQNDSLSFAYSVEPNLSTEMRSGTITFTLADVTRTHTVIQQGAAAEAKISIEQMAGMPLESNSSPIDWGAFTLAQGVSKPFVIENLGLTTLGPISAVIEGTHVSDFQIEAAPASSLAPLGATEFAVIFVPSGPGPRSATLRITSNDASNTPFLVPLSGHALEPEIEVFRSPLSPYVNGGASLDFGVRIEGDSSFLELRVANRGAGALINLAVEVDGPDAGDFEVHIPDDNLGPGESTLASLKFTPSDIGIRTATLLISSNDFDENPFTLSLTGFGGPRNEGQIDFLSYGDYYDAFGFAVAVSGNIMVVGAPYEDSAASGIDGDWGNNDATDSGAAYIFKRPASDKPWRFEAYLKPSSTAAGFNFGSAVAVSGETVVVGAPWESSDGMGNNGTAGGSGAVYVFKDGRENGWFQEAMLKASNFDRWDNFGASVAIDGDTIVVGAPGEDGGATGVNGEDDNNELDSSGAAYVFVRGGAVWSQQAYLKASNTGENDRFGTSVSVSGKFIVVGAPQEDSNARQVNGSQDNDEALFSGAAYVFHRQDGEWSQDAYLKASNADGGRPEFGGYGGDSFGASVAISGTTIVVGAPAEAGGWSGSNAREDDNSAPYAGAAYVFIQDEAGWSQEAYLKAGNTGAGDNFGHAVAIHGEAIIVGAPYEDGRFADAPEENVLYNAGAAYSFLRDQSVWRQVGYLKGDSFGELHEVGFAASVSLTTAAVGTFGVHEAEGNGTNSAELIYLFDLGLGPMARTPLETTGAKITDGRFELRFKGPIGIRDWKITASGDLREFNTDVTDSYTVEEYAPGRYRATRASGNLSGSHFFRVER